PNDLCPIGFTCQAGFCRNDSSGGPGPDGAVPDIPVGDDGPADVNGSDSRADNGVPVDIRGDLPKDMSEPADLSRDMARDLVRELPVTPDHPVIVDVGTDSVVNPDIPSLPDLSVDQPPINCQTISENFAGMSTTWHVLGNAKLNRGSVRIDLTTKASQSG